MVVATTLLLKHTHQYDNSIQLLAIIEVRTNPMRSFCSPATRETSSWNLSQALPNYQSACARYSFFITSKGGFKQMVRLRMLI
jgi:hypothetical protein